MPKDAGVWFKDSRSEVEMSGRSAIEESSNSHGGDVVLIHNFENLLILKETITSSNLQSHSVCAGSKNMGVILQGMNQDEESTSRPGFHSFHNIQQSNGCQEVGNSSSNQQYPQEILECVKINNTLESPLSTIKGVFKDSKDDELCFTKDELNKVEQRLRLVFKEFYQKLRLLKHYR